ncbi:MAG: sigma 54-interacting transcriptional regulator [Deltaproteobacteria bacterium]|nr:sigma 54-interacting transcriptional regulator [Deltaproteobacteria bacterium]
MASLKWLARVGRPRTFPIYKSITTVGRAGGNDVAIGESKMAEHHAQVIFDGRDFQLAEVDRVADIQLNGKKKRRGKLEHLDRILLGDVELEFRLLDDATHVGDEDATDTTQAELEGLRKLHEFSERLMQARNIQELLEALMDKVIEATHADKGFLVLLPQGSATSADRPLEPEVRVARRIRQEGLPDGIRHLSDSILRKVVETRRPLIVSDAMRDSQFGASESVMNLRLSSVMCAPLLAQGNLLGLIYLGNDHVVNLFEEASLDVLTIFAAQASLILQNALLLDQLRSDRDELSQQLKDRRFGEIIGTCPSMVEVFRKVEKVAQTDISVLITGDTGTGKELIAREIHQRSHRAKGPFVVINCGAIPENLMESELFGHVRGAFTGAVATRPGKFQLADAGTLFLDEIGELPINLQVKLLRALQEKTVMKVGDSRPERVDIRVVAATHRSLEEEIRKGTFREDLYYRLNVVNLHLPPLRDRGDDVLVIAKALLSKYGTELGGKVRGFTPNALIAIRKYEWPGNVRQLENRIKKAVVLCDKTLIGPDDLDLMPESLQPIMSLAQAKEDFQRRYILEALERNNGNRTKTARDLGVDPRTIFRYLEREPGIVEPDPDLAGLPSEPPLRGGPA